MSTTPPIPLWARPFSPSPPRESRHTASRPPSLLLGAPIPRTVTVAQSQSFSLSGLPSTPPPSKSIFDGIPPPIGSHPRAGEGYFNRQKVDIGRKGDEEGNVQGHFVRARSMERIRRWVSHPLIGTDRRRDSDSSSTSSSSPPLGATSLLAALAGPTPPSVPSPRNHSLATPHTPDEDVITDHRIGNAPSLQDKYRSPASPRSTRSLASSTSSSALTGSRSLPRLHQPTVVRRASGRLSFLPPPAQISPSGSSFALHQPHRKRAESDRSEGFSSMENLSRLNFGTVDSLGRYGLGSLESLGRPVEQDMRGVGFPAPTSSMDSLGKMDFGSMDSLGQVNFGSMESLAQVVKNGDLPGPSGAERYQGFGSSMENLSRVLERSTPANTAQTRDAGDHEPSGDMDGFVGPDANSVMADVMSGGLITVSHGKEQVKDGEAIAYGGGPDLGSMDTEGDTGQGADEFRDGRDIMADDHAQVVTAVRQDRVPDTPAAAETPPNIVAENVPTRERAIQAERPESVAIAEAQNRQNVPTPHQDTAASLDEGLSNKAGGTDISAEAQTPVLALDEPLAAEGSTDRTSLDEGREHLQEIADYDKSYSTSRDLSLLGTPAETSSPRLDEVTVPNPAIKMVASVQEGKSTIGEELRSPVEAEPELHEVFEQAPVASLVDYVRPSAAEMVKTNDAGEPAYQPLSMASTYQPLYKPRAKRHIGASQSLPATQARIPLPSSSLSSSLSASDKFTITLHAALSRQPRDGPLPFSLPHIELHLAWPEPERFKWVPGRKWVPSWRLSYVEGEDGVIVVRTNQDEKRGMVRGLAKGVVGSLPVVWRFAGWL